MGASIDLHSIKRIRLEKHINEEGTQMECRVIHIIVDTKGSYRIDINLFTGKEIIEIEEGE